MIKHLNFTHYLIFLIVFLISSIIFSCAENSNNLDESSDEEVTQDDDDDGSVYLSSSSPLCEEDDPCDHMCDMFRTSAQEEECRDLEPSIIRGMFKLAEYRLKSPVLRGDLNNIKAEHIDNFFNISSYHFKKNIEDFTSQDSLRTLAWIAKNNSITRAFYSDNRKNAAEEILEDLFLKISSSIAGALDVTLSGKYNFMKVAEREDNELAVRWAHEVAVEHCLETASNSSIYNSVPKQHQKHACILGEVYCKEDGRRFQNEYSLFRRQSFINYVENELGAKEYSARLDKICETFCSKFSNASAC